MNIHTQSPPDLAPPWRTSETWHEANQSVDHHIKRYGSLLRPLEQQYQDVKISLKSIFSILDLLCENTCPWCPDPCCLAATVWFDFPDLIFLHLSGYPIPPSQPKPDLKAACRYNTSRGCSLPRFSRPWICTWYLCDSQLACLRKKAFDTQDVFYQAVQAVRSGRKEMEAEFVRVITI